MTPSAERHETTPVLARVSFRRFVALVLPEGVRWFVVIHLTKGKNMNEQTADLWRALVALLLAEDGAE